MGQLVTVPKNIEVNEPYTDQVNKQRIELYWDDVNPYAVIRYSLIGSNGQTIKNEFIKLENIANDLTAGCLLEIKNVAEAKIWTDIQAKYNVVDK